MYYTFLSSNQDNNESSPFHGKGLGIIYVDYIQEGALIRSHESIQGAAASLKSISERYPSLKSILILVSGLISTQRFVEFSQTEEDLTQNMPRDFFSKEGRDFSFIHLLPGNNQFKVYVDSKFSLGSYDYLVDSILSSTFIKYDGIIQAPVGTHFKFPSGKHCNKYLRTANVLRDSSIVHLLADFTCIRIKEFSKTIYCDTSSILPVAYAIKEILRVHGKPKVLRIESFGSYEGIAKSDLIYDAASIILISASTSGNILKRIENQLRLSDSQAYILFGYQIDASNPGYKITICKLDQTLNENPGVIGFKSYSPPAECEFCNRGASLIPISGDAFLALPPVVNRILINKADFPKINKKIFRISYETRRGRSIESPIRARFRDTLKDSPYSQYISANELLENILNDGRTDLKDILELQIPVSIDAIITVDDEASIKVGELLKSKYYPPDTKIIDSSVLEQSLDEEFKDMRVLVVSATISSGRSFFYISQQLRRFKKVRPFYFTVVHRYESTPESLFINKTLSYKTDSFKALFTVQLNNNTTDNQLSQDAKYVQYFHGHSEGWEKEPTTEGRKLFYEAVNTRHSQYTKTTDGITSNLFFKRQTKHGDLVSLELRPTFAFAEFRISPDTLLIESEVLFVVEGILNCLRRSDNPQRQLTNSFYSRAILDPENFYRFNDGIIQASLLRAAHPLELDYRSSKESSRRLANMILNMIRSPYSEESEALPEFIFAIAIGKLKLTLADVTSILSSLSKLTEHYCLNFISIVKRVDRQYNRPLSMEFREILSQVEFPEAPDLGPQLM